MVTTLVEQNSMKKLLSGWGLSAKPCDICHTASALVYCRTDSTFFCGSCDSKIHTANHHDIMRVRHERVWMCEVCEQAPAAVTCKADAAVLCSSCDHDIHSANPLARRHERIPVTPFLDSAVNAAIRSNNSAAASTFLVPESLPIPAPAPAPIKFDVDNDNDDDAEAWLIPNPNSTFMYNDPDLLDFNYGCPNIEKIPPQQQQQQSIDSQSFAYSDSVVPTQSKGHLNSPNNNPKHLFECSFDIDFSQPAKLHNNNKHKLDNGNQQLFSAFNFSTQPSVSSSDIVVPDGTASTMSEVSYTFSKSGSGDGGSSAATGAQAPGLDRVARVLRYREKRKNRKFQKTIRYASRKAYAETRPRIKGRFAKRTENNNETPDIDSLFCIGSSSGSGSNEYLVDYEYGVVPTF